MKYPGRIRSILISALGGLATGVILCRICRFPATGFIPVAAAGFLGGFMGAITLEKEKGPAFCLFLSGLVLAAVLSFLYYKSLLPPLVAAGLYLLAFGALYKSGCGFYGPLGVWSTLFLCLALWSAGPFGRGWKHLLSCCCILCLIFTLDGFRDSSIRRALHRKRNQNISVSPDGLIQQHRRLMLYFLIGSFLLGLISFGAADLLISLLRNTAEGGLHGIVQLFQWCFELMEKALQWFSDLFPDLPPDEYPAVEDDLVRHHSTSGAGSAIFTLLLIICTVMVCAAAFVAAGTVLIRSRIKSSQDTTPDYEVEIEDLERPKLRLLLRKSLRISRNRDFSDRRQKIRFIFQQMLIKKTKQDPMAYFHTPNELLDPTTPGETAFISLYNRVRYGDSPVSDEELETAEEYYKRL